MLLLALVLYASLLTIYAVIITAMWYISKPAITPGRSSDKIRTIADVQRGEHIRYRISVALTGIARGIVTGNDPKNKKICIKTNWRIVDDNDHDKIIRESEIKEYVFDYDDFAVKDFQVLNPQERMVAQRSTYDLIPLLNDKLHDAEQNKKNEEAGIIRSCIIALQKIKKQNT